MPVPAGSDRRPWRRLVRAAGACHPGGTDQVYVDGGKVIQEFLRADLIDEITIGWAPVLIGDGLPLFGFLDHDIQLSLTAANASGSGMVHATYAVHRDPASRTRSPAR